MKSMQQGFTLIELVMVIVIIGLLSAVAIPKFVDLGGEARAAAMAGVTGALSSASAVNYAARKAGSANTVAVTNCTNVASAMQGGALPSGYTITSAAIAADASVTCTVTAPGTPNGSFVAIGIN